MAFPASHRAASFLARDQLLVLACGLAVLLVQAYQLAGAASSPASLACFPPDLAALQELAASFNSTQTPFFLTNWRPQADCCSWEGVTCAISANNESRVVGLVLVDRSLVGPFPHALCRLSALSSLHISTSSEYSENTLFGPFPSCIGHNLTNLQHLIFSRNHPFISTIPDSFSLLLSLKTLDLRSNDLFGSISPLANLPLLTHLNLSENSFNGTMPILNTPSLHYLDVSYNSFSGSLPSFNTTPYLRYLDLSAGLQWTGDIPALPHLLHLEELYLRDTSLSAQGSSISRLFCDLRSLKRLSIATESLGLPESKYSDVDSLHGAVFGTLDQQLQCERPSVNLTYLDISSNHLTGPLPAWIGLFSNLQHLDLSANNFSGSIPPQWQMLTQLTSLQLSGSSPDLDPQPIPDWIFRSPLATLRLRSMGLTMQDSQCELGLSLLNLTLQVLDLSDNHLSAGGSSLWHCLAHHNFTLLSKLYLSNNPLAFDLASSQPLSRRLHTLDLSSCQLVGRLTMEVLSSAEYSLNLGHNHLAGSIPSMIGSGGPQLTWLDLSFNNLTGPLPASMGNLSATGISLNNNHLDGEVRLSYGELYLGCLVVFNAANNHFTKAMFGNSSCLLILDLRFNNLEGDVQEIFDDLYSVLSSLSVLLLSHNELSGSIPGALGRLAPNLMVLELSNNSLTGAIPDSLKHLLALRTGDLASTPMVVDFSLQSVKGVKSKGSRLLGHLDLSSNKLNGPIPPALGELLGLNDLNLSSNLLSGPIPASLSSLTQLQSLDLSYNHLEGSIPTVFSTLSDLAVFNVSFNPKLSGQIPPGPQLERADSYRGDPNLCGYQIQKDCTPVDESEPIINVDHHRGRMRIVLDWIEEWSSIPGICLGYAVGLGVTIWVFNLMNFYG